MAPVLPLDFRFIGGAGCVGSAAPLFVVEFGLFYSQVCALNLCPLRNANWGALRWWDRGKVDPGRIPRNLLPASRARRRTHVWDARFIKYRKGRLTDKQGYLAIESTLHLADAPPPPS